MSNKNDDFGIFFAGLILGGVVGAVAALLSAPNSGEETRTVIKEKSIELRNRAVDLSHDARMKAEKAFEDASVRADEALQELRVRADDLAKVTKERALELKTKVTEPLETPVVLPEVEEASE